jgi:[ribosomal protein S18]-alanine N-acetyltransferase
MLAGVDVTIDAMTEADIPSVVALGSGATVGQLVEELARPWALCFVARDAEAKVLGFVLTWHVTDELHILDVVVDAAVRRRGIGRSLMQHALTRARERSAVHVYLEVRRTNVAAIHLYRALGFFTLAVRKKYYPDGEDAIEMAARMDPDTGEIMPGKDEVNPERV